MRQKEDDVKKNATAIAASLINNLPTKTIDEAQKAITRIEQQVKLSHINKEQIDIEVQEDYEYAREHYKTIIEQSRKAVELAMNLSEDSQHPRMLEVLGQLLRQSADAADKLLALQKDIKSIRSKSATENNATGSGIPTTTNNNIFVGSTTDLQRLILDTQAGKNLPEIVDEQ